MTENNATQPLLTDEEIMRSAINASDSLNITRLHEMGAPSRTIMDDAGLLELGRAIESALLSKLRAEGVQAGDEREALAWYAEQVVGCRKMGADGDAARQALDKDGGQRARAALASAPVKSWPVEQQPDGVITNVDPADMASVPVAGEVKPVAVLRFERGMAGKENEMPRVVSCNWMPDGDYPVYAAPQASEAVCSCPTGDGSLRHPCAVHPDCAKGAGDVRAVLRDARTVIKTAYVRSFGSEEGYAGEHGSWFIEGYLAALAAQPSGNSGELAAQKQGDSDE